MNFLKQSGFKLAIIIFITAALAVSLTLLLSKREVLTKSSSKNSEQPVMEQRYEPVRFDISNPFIILKPSEDARNIDLTANNLSGIKRINVTFTYNSKGVEQGVVERIDLEKEASQTAKRIYLGSCSESTGIRRCYDHTDVTNGAVSAVLDKMQDERNQEIKSDFKLMELKKEEGKLTSLDSNVQVTVTKGLQAMYVIAAALTGLPQEIPGASVIGQPYAFLPAKDISLTEAQVKFRLPPTSDSQGAVIYTWDFGLKKWKALPTTAEGNNLSANTKTLGIFTAAVPKT